MRVADGAATYVSHMAYKLWGDKLLHLTPTQALCLAASIAAVTRTRLRL